jgi:hypothetical protein
MATADAKLVKVWIQSGSYKTFMGDATMSAADVCKMCATKFDVPAHEQGQYGLHEYREGIDGVRLIKMPPNAAITEILQSFVRDPTAKFVYLRDGDTLGDTDKTGFKVRHHAHHTHTHTRTHTHTHTRWGGVVFPFRKISKNNPTARFLSLALARSLTLFCRCRQSQKQWGHSRPSSTHRQWRQLRHRRRAGSHRHHRPQEAGRHCPQEEEEEAWSSHYHYHRHRHQQQRLVVHRRATWWRG